MDEGIEAVRAALASASGPLAVTCAKLAQQLRRYAEDDTTLILARLPEQPDPLLSSRTPAAQQAGPLRAPGRSSGAATTR